MARDARVSRAAESQAQSASAESEQKTDNRPEDSDEIEFFDTMIVKIVTDEDGEEIEVLSDHLAPGEKLKRAVDEEKAAEKAEKARKDADDAARDRENG